MKTYLSPVLALLLACVAAPQQTKPRLRVTVTLARDVATEGASGRLLIFMSNKPNSTLRPHWDSDPRDLWIAAKEIPYLAVGDSVELDADDLAFPEPFSKAPTGEYRLRAVLDTNHTYAYVQDDDDGDLRSEISVRHLPVANIAVTLTERVTEPPAATPHAELIHFESRLLSEFWGRPVRMRGLIVLPPSYEKNRSQAYPTAYWTTGFGGTLHGIATYELPYYFPYMERNEKPEMIYVLLDQSCPFGAHEFANSANNGPWGDALVKELIPALERKYRMDGKASGRLLQGHSSCGWAALWLQVTYPDFFGGTWATAPDPADFRAFIPVDLTTARNMYRTLDGKRTVVMRANGKEIAMENYAHREMVLGEYGGQLSSFEAVFSPRGTDGRPMRLFDRVTGEIDGRLPEHGRNTTSRAFCAKTGTNWERGSMARSIYTLARPITTTLMNLRVCFSIRSMDWEARQLLCFFPTAPTRMSTRRVLRNKFGKTFGILRVRSTTKRRLQNDAKPFANRAPKR